MYLLDILSYLFRFNPNVTFVIEHQILFHRPLFTVNKSLIEPTKPILHSWLWNGDKLPCPIRHT